MKDKEYKGLKENLKRFKNDLFDEKTKLLFKIAYKQGFDKALSLFNVSKRFNFPNFIVGVMTGLTISLIYLHFAL